jgi:ATP-binding cassette, subfamily B, multidrug efflux pump
MNAGHTGVRDNEDSLRWGPEKKVGGVKPPANPEQDKSVEEDVAGKVYDRRLARRLATYLIPYKRAVAASLGVLLVGSLLQVTGPLLTKVAVDTYLAPEPVHPQSGWLAWLPADPWTGLAQIALLYFAILLVTFGLQFVETYLMQRTGQWAMFDLRRELMAKLQQLDIAYFDRNPVGRLVTRVTTDVDVLNELFASGLVTIAGDLLVLTFVLVAMFQLSPSLALILVAGTPLVVYFTALFRRTAQSGYQRTRTAIARINAFLNEHLTGIDVVHLFNRERRTSQEFARLNAEYRDAYKDTIFAYAWFYPVVEFVGILLLAAMLTWGGVQIAAGELTVGILAAFFQYGLRFFRPIQDLSEKYNILQSAMAAAERIFKLLDTEVRVAAPAAPTPFPARPGAIEFDRVWFAYKDEDWVLRDVSFRIEPGETIAVVGHTGAGKTTLITLLLRYYDVQRGAIRVGGHDLRDYDLRDYRRHFGVVLQDPHMFSGTIGENIRLGAAMIDEAELLAAVEQVNLRAFLESLPEGFEHPVRERGDGLSTGQKQLINFARALALQSALPDPGRSHLECRHGNRAAHPRGAGPAHRGAHLDRHCPPPLDDPARRPYPGDAQGRPARSGHAPGTAGAARHLLAPLPVAVPGSGSAAGWRASARINGRLKRFAGAGQPAMRAERVR